MFSRLYMHSNVYSNHNSSTAHDRVARRERVRFLHNSSVICCVMMWKDAVSQESCFVASHIDHHTDIRKSIIDCCQYPGIIFHRFQLFSLYRFTKILNKCFLCITCKLYQNCLYLLINGDKINPHNNVPFLKHSFLVIINVSLTFVYNECLTVISRRSQEPNDYRNARRVFCVQSTVLVSQRVCIT